VTQKNWLITAALAGALALGGWWWRDQGTPHNTSQATDSTPALFSRTVPVGTPSSGAAASGLPAPDDQRPTASPLDSMIPPSFRANSNGNLVIDPQTRVDVERVHALYQRDEALQKLDALSSGMPAKAQRELKDLYQQYAQYAQAVTQTYPPGLSLGTIDEARAQLKGLHELRQQYFGVEGAQAMFEQEEETSARLLALMSQNQDASLSLQEKAEQAQEAIHKGAP